MVRVLIILLVLRNLGFGIFNKTRHEKSDQIVMYFSINGVIFASRSVF